MGVRGERLAGWRWAVCAAIVALFVAIPFAVRYAPVPASDASPAALLARMQASWSKPYAGYAESTGALALPATDQLTDVSALLSSRTQLRVWWQSDVDWRADVVTPVGERSTRTTPSGVLSWDYEGNRVTTSTPQPAGTVRLPVETDLLPPVLARRMLGEATADEVAALPGRHVAGRPADGLRMTPADALSSIGAVDVWADSASGIPVLLEVHGRADDAGVPAVSTTFLDFTDAAPNATDLAFTRPPGSRQRSIGPPADLVRDIARSGGPPPPETLIGLARTPAPQGLETIGEYGRGVTQLVVGALPDRLAGSFRDQLALATTAKQVAGGITVSVGPMSLLLTTSSNGYAWLVAGTVTTEGLVQAAAQLGSAP